MKLRCGGDLLVSPMEGDRKIKDVGGGLTGPPVKARRKTHETETL